MGNKRSAVRAIHASPRAGRSCAALPLPQLSLDKANGRGATFVIERHLKPDYADVSPYTKRADGSTGRGTHRSTTLVGGHNSPVNGQGEPVYLACQLQTLAGLAGSCDDTRIGSRVLYVGVAFASSSSNSN
jgi:hypothetical protein